MCNDWLWQIAIAISLVNSVAARGSLSMLFLQRNDCLTSDISLPVSRLSVKPVTNNGFNAHATVESF